MFVALTFLAPASAAPSLASQTRDFKTDAMSLLRGYERDLGPRLSATERQQLVGVIAKANSALTRLVVTTRALDRSTVSNKTSRKAQALRAFSDAQAAEADAIAQVQPLAMRQLGIMGMINAKADLDRMNARFEGLGTAIRAA